MLVPGSVEATGHRKSGLTGLTPRDPIKGVPSGRRAKVSPRWALERPCAEAWPTYLLQGGRGPLCSGSCQEPTNPETPAFLGERGGQHSLKFTVPQLPLPSFPLCSLRRDWPLGTPPPSSDHLKVCFRDSCEEWPILTHLGGGRGCLGEVPEHCPPPLLRNANLEQKGGSMPETKVGAGGLLDPQPREASSSGDSQQFLSGRSEGPGARGTLSSERRAGLSAPGSLGLLSGLSQSC